jgi:hypothetical protein
MQGAETNKASETFRPPALRRDQEGQLDTASLGNLIQWFLDYDQRVAVIKHPSVEELFQWKQDESRRENEEIYLFSRAEDRLAVGIVQALMQYASERDLHGWISQLLNTLDEASKANEEIAGAYNLGAGEGVSVISEAAKIPTRRARSDYLVCCWLETLCTAEIRVLGWIYQELYGRAYAPEWTEPTSR